MTELSEEMPELPKEKWRTITTHGWGTVDVSGFTADQMRAIRLAAYKAGMERAAMIATELDCAHRCCVGIEVAATIRTEAAKLSAATPQSTPPA